jgi:hypothetical protein
MMAHELTYQVYDGPERPFKKGDAVTVTDREGMKLSQVKVVSVRGNRIKTNCGREWTKDGWRVGDGFVWPFPTIRL